MKTLVLGLLFPLLVFADCKDPMLAKASKQRIAIVNTISDGQYQMAHRQLDELEHMMNNADESSECRSIVREILKDKAMLQIFLAEKEGDKAAMLKYGSKLWEQECSGILKSDDIETISMCTRLEFDPRFVSKRHMTRFKNELGLYMASASVQSEEIGVVAPSCLAVAFEYDDAGLRPDEILMLDQTGRDLEAEKERIIRIQINGYASTEGTSAHNLQLSRQRANAVKKYLADHFDGIGEKIRTEGFGESAPICKSSGTSYESNGETHCSKGDGEEDRVSGRRAQIYIERRVQ